MVTTRTTFAAVLVLSSTFGSIAACRGSDDKAKSSPDAASDAAVQAAADAAPADAAQPYLPARPFNDDSPAPLSVVESALSRIRPQLHGCYLTAAKDNPKLEGQAVLAVTIGGDGHVTDVATVSQTGLDTSILACLTAVVKGAVFPPPADGGAAVFSVPLTVRPIRRPDAGPDSGR